MVSYERLSWRPWYYYQTSWQRDREAYLAEAEKQLQDVDMYEDTDFRELDLVKLVEKSDTMFQSLRRKNLIKEKELEYFYYQYKKSRNFCKMYLLPKIHKRLDKCTW